MIILLGSGHLMKALWRRSTTWRSKVYYWEISHAVSISLGLVDEDLLEYIIPPCILLHLLQDKVVGWSDLVVLVVLYKHWCLIIEVRICDRQERVVSNLLLRCRVTHIPHHCDQGIVNHWNWVFPDHDTFQIIWLYLREPLMRADIFDCEARLGVGVQNFLDQILAAGWDESWD